MKEYVSKLRQFVIKQGRTRISWAVLGLVLLAGLLMLGANSWLMEDGGRASRGPVTTVQRGPLTINVTENGTVRPREQLVLKNKLNDPATIIFIVKEGSLVKKGDLLVELDVSRREDDLVERRIRVQNDESDLIHAQENLKVVQNQAEADLAKAELTFRFAKQDLKKYIEGEYPKLLDEAKTKITLAEEELSQAEEELRWSKILFEEKYLSQSELQQDELAFKKTELNLKLAQADLELLQTYTHQRQLDQLNSDVKQAEMALERTKRMSSANIAQAEAELKSREAELHEEKQRLRWVEREIERAKIVAPIDGMVIYASSIKDRRRRDDRPIEVGSIMDEEEEIIYLPTALEYDVHVQVTEVDLNKVDPGLPARISIDAIPESVFAGKVGRVARLPDAYSQYLNPNLKLYDTVIQLDASEVELRNGMSCQAEIRIAHFPDAVFVPIQTITRVNGEPTVYVVGADETVVPRAVKVGLDNSRFARILSGVEAGEKILLAPPLAPSTRDGEEAGAGEEEETPELPGEGVLSSGPQLPRSSQR